MMCQDHVLGEDPPRAEPAIDLDTAQLGLGHRHALGGQHVAHLGGADAECHRAKRAVGAGVAVAAGNGHARLGEAKLRSNDVHDALATGRPVKERQVVGPHVLLDGGEHLLGHAIGVGSLLLRRWG